MKKKEYISGIYNYCDRWCEKCPMTDRCLNYEPISDEFGNIVESDKDLFETLSDTFDEVNELLKEQMEKLGIEWEDFTKEAMKTEIKRAEITDYQRHLKDIANDYHVSVVKWFDDNGGLLEEKATEFNNKHRLGIDVEKEAIKLSEAIEIIQFYVFFISVKLHRAFSGKQGDLFKDIAEDSIQNDANGSAKITKIAVERSIAAWEVVRPHFPEQLDKILDFLVLLTKLRKGILKEFPDVDKFIRPGFDE